MVNSDRPGNDAIGYEASARMFQFDNKELNLSHFRNCVSVQTLVPTYLS